MASFNKRDRESIRSIVADVQGTNVLEPKVDEALDDFDRAVASVMAEAMGYDGDNA